MKLWILKPISHDKGPWKPWYDKVFGFVVRAKTEQEARGIAHFNAGDENRTDKAPWLYAELSTCVELTTEGDAEMILRDFASA